ncbi:MAG: hypothetical protein ACLFM0_03075, partial [Spirochaetales bacterium]
GKAMCSKTSEIVVNFQRPPGNLFNVSQLEGYEPNSISICIQPREGSHFRYQVKVPDRGGTSRPVDMTFDYRNAFPDHPIPDAYERLLLDAITGDASLFARSDAIAASWRIIDPVLDAWERDPSELAGLPEEQRPKPLSFYEPGSWGPVEAEEMLARNGHRWRLWCAGRGDDSSCIEISQ